MSCSNCARALSYMDSKPRDYWQMATLRAILTADLYSVDELEKMNEAERS